MSYASAKQLAARFGVDTSTIWRAPKSWPDFPQPVKLSPGCTRWRLEDVEAWERKHHRTAA